MYGTQTHTTPLMPVNPFENDVKMYGTQTDSFYIMQKELFENDVKMYGTQTRNRFRTLPRRLRMM